MLPDLDIIVGGHSQTLLKKPRMQGGTVIVQAGANGAHIGILELSVDKGRVSVVSNSFLRPDDRHPEDDPVIRKLITEYETEVHKKYRKLRLK
jgi:5'-nucleotidase